LWCLDAALAGINASASTTAVTTGTIIFIAILPAIANIRKNSAPHSDVEAMAGVLIPGVRIKGAPRIRIVGLRVDAHLSSLLLVTGAFGRPVRIVKLIGHAK
jgi:hypothetical protein